LMAGFLCREESVGDGGANGRWRDRAIGRYGKCHEVA
jgi:hypothetical protein